MEGAGVEQIDSRQVPEGKVQHPVMMAIMMAGGVIILLLVVWLVTEGPDILSGSFDHYRAWPHTGALVDEEPIPGEELPEPKTFDLLGNATGWKAMVIVSEGGIVTAFWSNERHFENMSSERLAVLEGHSLESTSVRLGYDEDGVPTCLLEHGGEISYWMFDNINESWETAPGTVWTVNPRIPDIGIDDTPGHWPARVDDDNWDTVTIDGNDVVLGEYSWLGSGDDETFQAPAVLYMDHTGEWSTIVVMGRTDTYHQQIAGDSMDDIVIVSYNRHGWYVYTITDDTLTRSGNAPPTHGLPR